PSEQVTLDPQTANLNLVVDHKTVSFLGGKVTPRDTSKRFTGSPSVLGSQGFTSGRHYWEVNVGTEGSWAVGVALESVPRAACFSLLRSEKVWALHLDWDGQYTAECQVPFQVLVWEKLQKIRVCLDYDRGRVTFYNAKDMTQILQFKATFTEKVFPYFCLWSRGSLIKL
ncbi:TRI39 ligase, partial [Leptocoma aspasia]|nr:TRI39 ligase [Leptocoma aspasia]